MLILACPADGRLLVTGIAPGAADTAVAQSEHGGTSNRGDHGLVREAMTTPSFSPSRADVGIPVLPLPCSVGH